MIILDMLRARMPFEYLGALALVKLQDNIGINFSFENELITD